jgi:2-amino-4-hydroxy-6-hydroxymethyldihydropteridine diphosphokinase
MINTIYLGIGGNMDDRWQMLAECREQLLALGSVQLQSAIFKTAAWGESNQPDFYNQVVQVATTFSAQECLLHIADIEHQMGRVRTVHWAQRIIDIDILLYNNDVINETNLQVPHPYLHQRNFVLAPLVQIASDIMHPVLNKNIATLYAECSDDLKVEIVVKP